MHKPGNFERIAVRNTIVKFCMSVNKYTLQISLIVLHNPTSLIHLVKV